MLDKILLTISIALYAIAVPYLEINDTHVFNPDWVAHVRKPLKVATHST